MRTIDTAKRINSKSEIPNLRQKQIFDFQAMFIVGCLLIGVLAGCTQRNNIEQAQHYASKAEGYYQQAIRQYKGLIAQGKDTQRLHLELGKLYYRHGEFKQAIEELKKTTGAEAEKTLAISYYHVGNFTGALALFSKNPAPDDEYQYYHALTCEKLNLFDQALEIYRKIKSEDFARLSLERIHTIEKQINPATIKELDPAVSEIIAQAPAQEKYPQAGALILYCGERIEITPENTEESYLHYIIKILNDRGKQDFSESQIEYDSTYESVELEFARTIKPDGTIAEVGTRHIRDVSKYLNFPLYSNVRVFIISFPEITEGAVVEYKLKIHRSQLVNKKDFFSSYPLQTQEPLIRADFTIEIPKEKALKMKTLNTQFNTFGADLKPEIRERGSRLIYRWQFKNIPQVIPEPQMPPHVEINPAILFSTFDSWQQVYQWWWQLAREKIKADAAIKDKVKELIGNCVSEEEKTRAIYNFCARQIRYVAVEYGQAGYEPHKAEDIYRNKYGDCKDKAVLLVTMLKEAGCDASLVLISTRDYYNLNPDFPSLLFNHCIAAAFLKGNIVFMDPTAETCSFGDLPSGDQDREVLLFKESGHTIVHTPLFPAQHNLIKQGLRLKINHDETISAERTVETLGGYDQGQRYWLLYTLPELITQALTEKIQEVSIGAKLENYALTNLNDLNQPVVLRYAFRGPEYFVLAGNLRIMPALAFLDTMLVAKEKRIFAIDFGILETREVTGEIEIPDNFSVRYLPPSLSEESPWLNFKVAYQKKNDTIIFSQATELKKDRIAAEDYPKFKDFIEGLAKRIKQRVILEKVK